MNPSPAKLNFLPGKMRRERTPTEPRSRFKQKRFVTLMATFTRSSRASETTTNHDYIVIKPGSLL